MSDWLERYWTAFDQRSFTQGTATFRWCERRERSKALYLSLSRTHLTPISNRTLLAILQECVELEDEMRWLVSRSTSAASHALLMTALFTVFGMASETVWGLWNAHQTSVTRKVDGPPQASVMAMAKAIAWRYWLNGCRRWSASGHPVRQHVFIAITIGIVTSCR